MKHHSVLLLVFLALALTSCQVSQASARIFQPEAEVPAGVQELSADSPESSSDLQPLAEPTVGSVVITNSTAVPGSTESSASALPPSPALQQLAEQARHALADQFNIDLASIELVRIVPAKWPYDSLGCPLPEAGSVDESTPGYQILLEVDGRLYTYHTDGKGWIGLCEMKPRDEIRTLP